MRYMLKYKQEREFKDHIKVGQVVDGVDKYENIDIRLNYSNILSLSKIMNIHLDIS